MVNFRLVAACAALSFCSLSHADPINLSTWQELTLNYPGGQGPGNWILEPGNTSVQQVINADPSFYLNNTVQGSYTINGTWQVTQAGSGDDDYMGFVFGYQNSSNFYLFDWKRGTQGYVGRTATEGMTVKKFTGATGDGLVDLSLPEFWENQVDFGDMDVLDTNHSATAGWVVGSLYSFQLDFNLTAGKFRIIVKDGGTTLWDTEITDNTFVNGQFGFYNNSQSNVRYAGFEQVVTPLPEPASLALVVAALGIAGVANRRRRA